MTMLTEHGRMFAKFELCEFTKFSSSTIKLGGIGPLLPKEEVI